MTVDDAFSSAIRGKPRVNFGYRWNVRGTFGNIYKPSSHRPNSSENFRVGFGILRKSSGHLEKTPFHKRSIKVVRSE